MHMEKRVTLEYILYVFCADTNYYINCHGIFSFFNQWFNGANLVLLTDFCQYCQFNTYRYLHNKFLRITEENIHINFN